MRDASIEQQATGIEAPPVRDVWMTPSLRVLGTLADLTASGSKSGKENRGNVHGNKP